MREILFRGKCINTGNWVYGCLVNNMFTYSEYSEFEKGAKVCEIITGDYESDNWEEAIQEETNLVRVIHESVGQFTGLTDKNNKKLYEGDIVSIVDNTGARELYIFEWRQDMYQVIGVGGPGEWLCLEEFEDCEFIGTIHDKDELLK